MIKKRDEGRSLYTPPQQERCCWDDPKHTGVVCVCPPPAWTHTHDTNTMGSVNLQQQIRDNSREVNDFLRDLSDWTGEVKEKDRALLLDPSDDDVDAKNTSNSTTNSAAAPPPVRGRVDAHHVKSEEDLAADTQSVKKKKKQPPSSSASTTVKAPEAENETSCTSRDMGNACFKTGDYATAMSHYTRCIEHEGGACAAYANRAMCGIKLGRWTEAEADCTEALRLEPTYLKAHQRRGITRRELGKYLESTIDFEQALRLEPNSKILVNERNDSKTAYELEARLRPTQPRRVVKINLKKKREDPASQTMETVAPPPACLDVETPATASRAATTTFTSSSSSSSSSKKPIVNIVAPRTGAEFESLWNRLKTNPDRRMELMRLISPGEVSSIFKSGVAAPIFTGIIRLCLEGCASNTLSTAVPMLTAMTSIPRFDMAVMFITGGARKELQNMWNQAASERSGDDDARGSDDLMLLRKKYKLL
jgi:tetratricopeptide (TPR) repeat protein